MRSIFKPNSSSTFTVVKQDYKPLAIKSMVLSLMSVGLSGLSGCATTQELTSQQCQAGNWQEIGYTDGANGRSGAYFGHYINGCADVSSHSRQTPNRIQWEQGRQQGLKQYCTELHAYKVGREGDAWQPICPLGGIEKLEEAYTQGRYDYMRQRHLDSLRLAYPFGYGYEHLGDRYQPFGYRW